MFVRSIHISGTHRGTEMSDEKYAANTIFENMLYIEHILADAHHAGIPAVVIGAVDVAGCASTFRWLRGRCEGIGEDDELVCTGEGVADIFAAGAKMMEAENAQGIGMRTSAFEVFALACFQMFLHLYRFAPEIFPEEAAGVCKRMEDRIRAYPVERILAVAECIAGNDVAKPLFSVAQEGGAHTIH